MHSDRAFLRLTIVEGLFKARFSGCGGVKRVPSYLMACPMSKQLCSR